MGSTLVMITYGTTFQRSSSNCKASISVYSIQPHASLTFANQLRRICWTLLPSRQAARPERAGLGGTCHSTRTLKSRPLHLPLVRLLRLSCMSCSPSFPIFSHYVNRQGPILLSVPPESRDIFPRPSPQPSPLSPHYHEGKLCYTFVHIGFSRQRRPHKIFSLYTSLLQPAWAEPSLV